MAIHSPARIYSLHQKGGGVARFASRKVIVKNRTMSEQQARRVVEALNEGKTIANITKSGTPSYILNHTALCLFRQKHPKFDRLVVTPIFRERQNTSCRGVCPPGSNYKGACYR
jgi:predicted lipase